MASTALMQRTRGFRILYTAYKNNGGMLKWNNFKTAVANGDITFEMRPTTIYTNKET